MDEAYKTVSANFKHHNAYFPADVTAIKEGMRENAQKHPNRVFEVQSAIEEGDRVSVHSKIVMQMETEMTISVVHLFRFEGDSIAEMWDIGMVQPANVPNANGLF